MFIITIIVALCILETQSKEVKLNTCKKELLSCKLTHDQLFGSPGPRGDQGDKGERGVTGSAGHDGFLGAKGNAGESVKGLPGLKGDKGEKGSKEVGRLGLKGNKGNMGVKGSDGKAGPNGRPGLPGSDSYPCKICNDEENDEPNSQTGEKSHTATVTCKSLLNDTSDIYYVGPGPMAVYCNKETRETCLRSNTTSIKIFYAGLNNEQYTNEQYISEKGPFWLSQITDLKTLYNLTNKQISWFHKWASSAKQTLRYHCNNSVPYSASNISSSVQLLTWNDVVIESRPSDRMPLHYTVQNKTHNCEQGSKSKQYSDIVLKSTNVYRFPIIDIRIRDVRDEPQMFYIEHVEICFK